LKQIGKDKIISIFADLFCLTVSIRERDSILRCDGLCIRPMTWRDLTMNRSGSWRAVFSCGIGPGCPHRATASTLRSDAGSLRSGENSGSFFCTPFLCPF